MDDLIQSYRSLRAMLEDVVATWPAGVSEETRGAITTYLRTHCRDCGMVIPESLRRIGESRCSWCRQPPRPAIQRGLELGDPDDTPPF